MADRDPGEAWVKLVSALETTAAAWAEQTGTPSELLEEGLPAVAARLREMGGGALIDAASPHLTHLVRATRRFLDSPLVICLTHRRDGLLSLNKSTLDWQTIQKTLRVVYGWRSRALHDGFAMPWAMCAPPRVIADGAIQEAPFGEEAYGEGRLLDRAELPILLQTFEYIAAGARVPQGPRPARRPRGLLGHHVLRRAWAGAGP